jgi:hypothetical protein
VCALCVKINFNSILLLLLWLVVCRLCCCHGSILCYGGYRFQSLLQQVIIERDVVVLKSCLILNVFFFVVAVVTLPRVSMLSISFIIDFAVLIISERM